MKARILTLCLLVSPALADVQYVGTATSTLSVNSATVTISGHTVPVGVDRVLVVTVAWDNRAGATITGLTWNTTEDLAQLRTDASAANSRATSSMWYLIAPTAMTADVVLTWSASHNKPRITGAMNFVGVDQITPFDGTGVGAFGADAGPATIDVTTSAPGDMVVDVFAGYRGQSASVAVGALQTSRWQNGVSGTEWGGSSTEPGAAGTVTKSWSGITNASLWAISAGNLNAAAAGGVCGDGSLDFGEDCDDGNTIPGDCCSATCMYEAVGATCDDGDACTVSDTCDGVGVCQSGSPPDCSGTGDQCNADGTCDPGGLEGNCDTAGGTINEGLPCDDGDACNLAETCQTGACTGGAGPDCSGSGDQCNTASCDPVGAEGNCDTITPANEGLACDDGNACNVAETCQAGACTGGAGPDCSGSGDQCNTASCDPAGLDGNCDTFTPINEGLACDDGDACNLAETCQTGACTGGAGPDCSGSGDQCNTATCDPVGAEGNCDTITPANEGLACDDGNACNVAETCQTGACTGGAGPDCSGSGDQCNSASCDPVGAEGNCDTITPANEGLACDDGQACTDAVCQAGNCVFSNNAGQVTVNIEIDALGPTAPPLARDVTFVITACPGSVDIRVVPVAFDVLGSGTAILDDVDSNAAWIQVSEGHTLAKLAPLSWASCAATVNLTGASQLISGDFQGGIVVQDNLVDLVDFSILASNWDLPTDPTWSTGADASGDGVQGTADFTAIQINFFEFGDGTNGCSRGAGGDSLRFDLASGLAIDKVVLRSRIPIDALPIVGIESADINGDGFVDAEDVRLFALQHDQVLLPDFGRKLRALEAIQGSSRRGR